MRMIKWSITVALMEPQVIFFGKRRLVASARPQVKISTRFDYRGLVKSTLKLTRKLSTNEQCSVSVALKEPQR